MLEPVVANNTDHLHALIRDAIQQYGPTVDLNPIDVSNITDMDELFEDVDFQGDISEWNVSNVTTMAGMFRKSKYHGDLSKWDLRRLKNASQMFERSNTFEASDEALNISTWELSSLETAQNMFFQAYIPKIRSINPKIRDARRMFQTSGRGYSPPVMHLVLDPRNNPGLQLFGLVNLNTTLFPQLAIDSKADYYNALIDIFVSGTSSAPISKDFLCKTISMGYDRYVDPKTKRYHAAVLSLIFPEASQAPWRKNVGDVSFDKLLHLQELTGSLHETGVWFEKHMNLLDQSPIVLPDLGGLV